MSSIQEKATASILRVIRARRESASAPASGSPLPSPGALPRPAIREASFSDFSAVAALKQRGGLVADSLENWERLWRHNPALTESHNDRPIGWVLEADGAIVGYLGNISLLCRFGDRTLTAVTSHGLVVDPPYRSLGLTLVAAFFRQKFVDLFLSTSAIESVGKIALAFKSSFLPQPDYDTVLFWVLQPRPFARALMKKLQLKPPVSGIGEIATSIAMGADKILRKRRPKRSSAPFAMSEITISEIDDDFEVLWVRKVDEAPRVLADRSPATLRWHYEIAGDRGSVRVLCCRRNGELVGYAMLRTDQNEPDGLRKSMIADMVARQDDPEIVSALCVAAHDYAKSSGSHVLEVTGFPSSIRKICSDGHPYRRKLPACPYFYKATDPVLHKTLSDPAAWYACPFDGDATLIRPSYSGSGLPHTTKLRARDTASTIMSDVLVRKHTEVL